MSRYLPAPILTAALALSLSVATAPARGQEAGAQGGQPRPVSPSSVRNVPEEPPVVRQGKVEAGGRTLEYTVTTGLMPLKTDAGEKEADIFFIAYTLNGQRPEQRPLLFAFNGGPGSSSVWLHLGALGPKRIPMLPDGGMPPPPYRVVDNPSTWLTDADLVFIDPVGTGYSRPARPDLGQKFWGLRGDIESVSEFIRLYMTRYARWSSPVFLAGESYGTTRAAGLAGSLVEKGIALNGVMLISTILNFQTARFTRGNDLPYALFLPTYTATAWYHKKLAPELQRDLKKTLAEAEKWVTTEYMSALAKGDTLTPEERKGVVERVARYTGLSQQFVDQSDLRIEIFRFCKELLRDQNRTVGRLDSRFKGIDESLTSETPDFDPSMAAIRPPYTAAFNDYVRRELGYESDRTYHILGGGIGRWEWDVRDQGFADTGVQLRAAFAKNPYMKLFVASGYYDLATPHFAARYTLSHMGLDLSMRKNVTLRDYEAGHMMYIDEKELVRLKDDAARFIKDAVPPARP